MQFTLAERPFELTDANLRRKLEGRVPEPIQEYWVDVDGTRWPVKRLFGSQVGLMSSSPPPMRSTRQVVQLVGTPPRPSTITQR